MPTTLISNHTHKWSPVGTLLFSLLILMNTTLCSAQRHSLSDIEFEAKSYLMQLLLSEEVAPNDSQIDIEIRPIDQRLTLTECDSPLQFNADIYRNNFQRVSIKVECNGTPNWSFYIRAHVRAMQAIVVSRSSIPRDSIITSEHLTLKNIDITQQFRGYFTNPDQLIGSVARYPIRSGKVITAHQVAAKLAVNTGDRVIITSQATGFSIAVNGLALAGGQVGEQIKVKNIMSNREILAKIESEGVVTVK